ncbi:thermoresistant gluconokinase [Microdochium trichocladiopsis]|uniref:Gluconokinase n=1 Tax=Microdochium trichocladiopsis TaxID=1682393 RepID=A0A9P8YCA2_9PEZI|nr:thermoresistant gluconokinase [Microdochium trichocladiopsis]KAH7035305.1 thermoresistant gluconokinase [Microdochium trichocladiopsis]
MLSYDAPVSVNGQTPTSKMVNMNINNLGPNPAPKKTTMTPVTPNNTIAKTNGHSSPAHHHIWLVTGPAGCGKSTVASHLATSLNLPYVEGDEFHPQANIEKMAAGIPLTDADRWDWLTVLREQALQKLSAGAEGVVVTCSALKRKYRDVIRVAPYYSHDVLLHFIYLHAPEEVLLERVGARQGHYMGANMVHSQFSILEPPTAEEQDVISIDVSKTMDAVVAEALSKVQQAVDESSR